jgi:hypothetical protein
MTNTKSFIIISCYSINFKVKHTNNIKTGYKYLQKEISFNSRQKDIEKTQRDINGKIKF